MESTTDIQPTNIVGPSGKVASTVEVKFMSQLIYTEETFFTRELDSLRPTLRIINYKRNKAALLFLQGFLLTGGCLFQCGPPRMIACA